jgi:octopine/nopaline transport system permease protein
MDTYVTLFGFGPEGWGKGLAAAALVTVAVGICAFALGMAIGLLSAWCRIAGPPWASAIAAAYSIVLRGVPDLLVIYLFYFGGRQVLSALAHAFGHSGNIEISGFLAGAMAIGLISGAGQSEVFRGAFAAVPTGTIEAARVTGMHPWTVFRRIIAPQALPTALPGMSNQWQSVVKETALVSVTGLVETLGAVNMAARSTSLPFVFFLAGAVIYLLITTLSGFVFRLAEWRPARGAHTTY